MRMLRRSIAWALLASLLSVQGVVWAAAAHHAAQGDDAACAIADGPQFIGPHHQAGEQVEATDPPRPIEHCAICHQQRAVNSARFGRVAVVSAPAEQISSPIDAALAISLFVLPTTVPRGPPSTLNAL